MEEQTPAHANLQSAKITHQISMDDLLKYNLFHSRTSKTVQTARRRIMISVAVCLFIIYSVLLTVEFPGVDVGQVLPGGVAAAGLSVPLMWWKYKYTYPAASPKDVEEAVR